MKYSERLGEIKDKQIQIAVQKHNLGNLISTEKITSGLFGQNLFFTTDKAKYVLRGKPHFDWQFYTEKFFAEKLNQIGIPTPIPYIVDSDQSIFGWEFVIMPRLEGIPISSKLNEDYLNQADRKEIAEAQGSFLAKVQKLSFDYCGKYDPVKDKIVQFKDGYPIYISKIIKKRLLKAQENNPKNTSYDDIAWVDNLLSKASTELSQSFTPSVVLQDYKFENTLVKKENGRYKISALFDLMECYVGNGEVDLSRTYCKYIDAGRTDLAKIFIETWKESTDLIQGFTARFPMFIILDRSIIWEWNQRNPEVEEQTFRSYTEHYLI